MTNTTCPVYFGDGVTIYKPARMHDYTIIYEARLTGNTAAVVAVRNQGRSVDHKVCESLVIVIDNDLHQPTQQT